MRVYIGCFGSGLGHAARMLEIAKELEARGAELEFSSSGEVSEMINRRGYRCNDLPLVDVRYSDNGEFQVKETLLDAPNILNRNNRQFLSEIENISKFGPDAVLSDSALPTALAGRFLRVPTYTVLNQLSLTSSHEKRGALSRLFSVGMTAGMGKIWELSDEIFLPDLPPPYTISEKNLWGAGFDGARYVGFLFSRGSSEPDKAALELSRDPRPKVFWQVSGPPRTRKALLEKATDLAGSLADRYAVVISGGDPTGSPAPRKIRGAWYYEWCAIADLYFRECDVVISRAGHGTIAQAIGSSKPMLLIPIPKQPEQEGNAEKAARLGIAIAMDQGELDLGTLERALASLMESRYRAKSAELGALASRYDARAAIVSRLVSGPRRGRRGLR